MEKEWPATTRILPTWPPDRSGDLEAQIKSEVAELRLAMVPKLTKTEASARDVKTKSHAEVTKLN